MAETRLDQRGLPEVNPFRSLVAQFREALINLGLYVESTCSCILRVLANWYLGFISVSGKSVNLTRLTSLLCIRKLQVN